MATTTTYIPRSSTLPNAPPPPTVVVKTEGPSAGEGKTEEMMSKLKKNKAMFYLILFIIVFIIAFLIFYLMKPSIVMKKIGDKEIPEVDMVKVTIGSLIVAVIILVLAWLFSSIGGKY